MHALDNKNIITCAVVIYSFISWFTHQMDYTGVSHSTDMTAGKTWLKSSEWLRGHRLSFSNTSRMSLTTEKPFRVENQEITIYWIYNSKVTPLKLVNHLLVITTMLCLRVNNKQHYNKHFFSNYIETAFVGISIPVPFIPIPLIEVILLPGSKWGNVKISLRPLTAKGLDYDPQRHTPQWQNSTVFSN